MTTDILYSVIVSLVPIPHNGEHDARRILEEAFSRYKNRLKSANPHVDADTNNRVDDLCNVILSCFDYAYSGNHTKAYKILCPELHKLSYVKPYVEAGESFYRMRLREDKVQFGYKDLMPIPDDKRYLVKTQRFSMPGLPCLYLGYHTNACWEEMHRPPIGNCMVSRYEVIKKFQVISLEIPSYETFASDVKACIRLFPLIMACMVTVADYNDPYKSAYLIPQLIMEWLTCDEKAIHQDFKGVRFTSVHLNEQFGYPQVTFNNLALPVPGPKNHDYAKGLDELFMLTEPTSEEYERIKNNLDEGIVDNKIFEDPMGRYSVSMFGLLERNLKDRKDFPLKEMKKRGMSFEE